ncbi:MAG: hypothetical protein KBF89_02185 [Acidimicrobiia bacterium]|nr:hypothetical protein [Acidimicrobiia bacterium]
MEIKNLFRRNFNKTKNNESGYALVAVLGIVILTIGILSSMTLMTLSDVQSSSKNRAVLEARLKGESGLDTIYSAVNASKSLNITEALGSIKIGSTEVVPTSCTPTVTTSGKVLTKTYCWGPQISIAPTGDLSISCPDATKECIRLRLKSLVTSATDYDLGITGNSGDKFSSDLTNEEYIIDIAVRTKCKSNLLVKDCTYSRMQQNISKRKYVEYASISQTETVADSVILNSGVPLPATDSSFSRIGTYSGQDVFNGNIHSNSSVILACNGFRLFSDKYITSTGIAGNSAKGNPSISGCNNGPTSGNAKESTRLAVVLPDRVGDQSAGNLQQIAKNENSTKYNYRYNTNLTFRDNGTFDALVGGTTKNVPMPSNGVIFLEQGGSISGTVKGKVTIASAPGPNADILISNNLVYLDPTKDLLGVYSGKDIIIACIPSGSACRDITVNGYLKANTDYTSVPSYLGTIYTQQWATSAPGGRFTLFGAMESYNRGTFGSIESVSNGNVTNGFIKYVVFDNRLLYEQPPSMLRDGTVPFIRSSIKDIPCDNACTRFEQTNP